MTNNKKGLLSLVTALALASSAMASSYVPLTSASNDDRWILYGVNGFKLDGATAASTALFTVWGDAVDTQVTDNTIDEVSVSGLRATAGDASTEMGEIKALNLPTGALSAITINVDSISEAFSATEPMRTMYFKAQGNSYADAMFTYKASLEGKTLEYQYNGDATKTYTITINALNTFDNPATRAEKTAADGSGGIALDTIPLAMDYDLLDNPQDPANYNRVANSDNPASHQTANNSASTRMYGYNANTNSWEIYDSGNSALANDFTLLKKGKAYWAKVDLDDDDNSDAHTKAGLVLGASGLVSSDYDGEITTAWNLMSFDGAKPTIRTSNTGMIITDALAGGTIDIIDSTGVNTVTVNLPAGSTQADAIAISMAIESAKSNGLIPDTFDLRAFRVDADEILLISNKKFSVLDTGNTEISAASTMAGKPLWDIANNALFGAAGADIPATGASTVYGESALILQPLVAAGTASQLDNTEAVGVASAARSAKIKINTNTPLHLAGAGDDDAATFGDTVTNFISDATIDNAVIVDLDNNGTEDYVLIAADESFYIRDYTFTRVMSYDSTNSGNTIKIASPISATITTTGAIGTTIDNINAVADENDVDTDTAVYAAADGAKILFISAGENANNFNIFDDVTEDYLIDTTSSLDIAKGAVKDIYSIDYLAKQALVPYVISIDINETTDNAGDTIVFALNSGTNSANASQGVVASTAVAYTDMFNAYILAIKNRIIADGLDATVTHDFTETSDVPATLATALAAAKITVSGYGINHIVTDYTNSGGSVETDANTSSTAGFGVLNSPIANLTSDLKYNAIYTPDYAKDGPLYTLKGIGYTPQSMVTGSTFMSDGSISWDNIDLTRKPAEWFRNSDGTIHNDYNLFSIDGKAGYWVYLINNTDSNDLAISNVTIKPTYIHHFNNNLTTINHVAATIQLTVTGLPTDTSSVSVYANVGGSNVELASTSNNGIYSGSLTSYEVQNLTAGGIRDITVSVADGLGYRIDSVTVGSIDYEKPITPTVNKGNGTNVSLSSTSSDATGYYIYKDAIPEESTGTSNSKIIKLLASEASGFNLCSISNSFGTEYIYRAFAMDGLSSVTGASSDGELGYGNASDALEFTFSATLKSSSLLTNTQGVDADATSLAVSYDATCKAGATDTQDAGISLKSIDTDTRVRMSYKKESNVSFTTDAPLTIYVGISAAGLAEVKYVPAYGGNTFYIEFNNVVYSGVFPLDDNANGSSSSALNVSGNTIVGQTF
ncbi:MAG: hypothetical protein U9P72_08250 [Campylobacterota bacterium]|nr:hypothetical protein [Campylobacterota bacterium]